MKFIYSFFISLCLPRDQSHKQGESRFHRLSANLRGENSILSSYQTFILFTQKINNSGNSGSKNKKVIFLLFSDLTSSFRQLKHLVPYLALYVSLKDLFRPKIKTSLNDYIFEKLHKLKPYRKVPITYTPRQFKLAYICFW